MTTQFWFGRFGTNSLSFFRQIKFWKTLGVDWRRFFLNRRIPPSSTLFSRWDERQTFNLKKKTLLYATHTFKLLYSQNRNLIATSAIATGINILKTKEILTYIIKYIFKLNYYTCECRYRQSILDKGRSNHNSKPKANLSVNYWFR